MVGYVAKDKRYGEIYLHIGIPQYDDTYGGWFSQDMLDITGKFPEFKDMSYTDEPIKVEIKLERV